VDFRDGRDLNSAPLNR